MIGDLTVEWDGDKYILSFRVVLILAVLRLQIFGLYTKAHVVCFLRGVTGHATDYLITEII